MRGSRSVSLLLSPSKAATHPYQPPRASSCSLLLHLLCLHLLSGGRSFSVLQAVFSSQSRSLYFRSLTSSPPPSRPCPLSLLILPGIVSSRATCSASRASASGSRPPRGAQPAASRSTRSPRLSRRRTSPGTMPASRYVRHLPLLVLNAQCTSTHNLFESLAATTAGPSVSLMLALATQGQLARKTRVHLPTATLGTTSSAFFFGFLDTAAAFPRPGSNDPHACTARQSVLRTTLTTRLKEAAAHEPIRSLQVVCAGSL